MAQQAQIEQALAAHERIRKSTDLPLWYGIKGKDTITAHDWLERFETASLIANWVPAPAAGQQPNYARKCQEFFMLLRAEAVTWYRALGELGQFDYTNWPLLREKFLTTFAPRYTSRTACLSFSDLAQRSGEGVVSFFLRVSRAHHLLKETRPATMFDVRDPPQAPNVDIADLAARQAAVNAAIAQAQARSKLEGINDMSQYFAQQLFQAGLNEDMRIKILERNFNNVMDAYEAALSLETIIQDKRGTKPLVTSVQDEQPDEEGETENVIEDEDDEEMLSYVNSLRRSQGKPPIKFSRNGKFKSKLSVTCRYCKKKGHFQKECMKRKRENGTMLDAQGKPYKVTQVEDDDESEYHSTKDEEDEDSNAIQAISNFYGINSISQERADWLDEVGDGREDYEVRSDEESEDENAWPNFTQGLMNYLSDRLEEDDQEITDEDRERMELRDFLLQPDVPPTYDDDRDMFQTIGGERSTAVDEWETSRPPTPAIYRYVHLYSSNPEVDSVEYRYNILTEYSCICMFPECYRDRTWTVTNKPALSGIPFVPETDECFCGLERLFQLPTSDEVTEEDWHLAYLFGEEEYPSYEKWLQEVTGPNTETNWNKRFSRCMARQEPHMRTILRGIYVTSRKPVNYWENFLRTNLGLPLIPKPYQPDFGQKRYICPTHLLEQEEDWYIDYLFGEGLYPPIRKWTEEMKRKTWPKRMWDTRNWINHHMHLLTSKNRAAIRQYRLSPPKQLETAYNPPRDNTVDSEDEDWLNW